MTSYTPLKVTLQYNEVTYLLFAPVTVTSREITSFEDKMNASVT